MRLLTVDIPISVEEKCFAILLVVNVTVVFICSFHQVIVELVAKVSKREAVSLPDDIFGYKEAQANGDRFYVAAQFDRGKLPDEFILGNGKTYGGYENAPLQPETKYKAYLRGVTEHNGVRLHNIRVMHQCNHKISIN